MINSAGYDAALRQRGSPTVWFTDAAIAAWKAAPRTTPGGQPCYSDLAITTALMLRAVFRLTERWMRLRAASVILTAAIERYRAANQDPLVTRASAIFAAMAGTSDNPITRLSVDYADEARPSLVAYRRDGSQLQLSGMSDGTLDQLYLALRIAAIERYVETAEPLPFIADDLFITSDEERTIPGIRALAELGKKTQVILFTHHQYVVDSAVSALAPHNVKVHSLAGERVALEPA